MVQGISKREKFFVVIVMTFFFSQSPAQEKRTGRNLQLPKGVDSIQSIPRYIDEHLSELAPRDYIEQKKLLNLMQKQGHIETLFAAVNHDGVTALFGYFKTTLNTSLGFVHRTFEAVRIPLSGGGVLRYNFPDDVDYPLDPWKKEWWYYR
jgi:hypothetical protein